MSKTKTLSTKPRNTVVREPDIDEFSLKMVIAFSAVLSVLAAVLFDKTKDLRGYQFVVFGMAIAVAAVIYLAVKKQLNTRNIILMIFYTGFVERLNYVLFTSVTNKVRQHDMYFFGGERGHSAYIEHFYNNGFTMPDFNPTTQAQFYHPPLHHFLSALWMRLLTAYGMSYERAIASITFLTLFYSMCSLVLCERILNKLGLRGFGKIIPLAIMAFHPTFLLFSGSANNDNLATTLTLLAFYAALKWYSEPTTKNIMLIALAIGLGMSTKLSVAMIAPPIAVLFLYRLITDKENIKKNILQYASFAVVCLPLGLWFYIRNYIKYKVPITYVPRLSDFSDQYLGKYTVYERLFDYSYHPFKNVFINRIVNGEGEYFEYNPFVTILKTSMFGEYTFTYYYEKITPFCRILFFVNVILVILSIVSMIYCLVRKIDYIDRMTKIFIASYYLLIMGSYFKFIFDFPHNCSMDFRYLPMTFVVGSIFIGMAAEQIKLDFPKAETVVFSIRSFIVTCTVSFCVFSALVYILIGV